MGIKTKFNPMGGGNNEKGKLSDWRYSTAANGQITLYEYLGTYSSVKPVYVPVKKGKTVINKYTSGTTTTASNTPFFNNPNLVSVDLQNVPFTFNRMDNAFNNCQNLTSVNNINPSVTNMANTFNHCTNLNQNIQIPNSVTDMTHTFYLCYNLNQNIQIPNSVTSMYSTFWGCVNLNQNIQIPNSVTNMYATFESCYNLNQNIQIPNSVTNMSTTFRGCYNLNQNIQIPNSVTNMYATFRGCNKLNRNIRIGNSVTNMSKTFYACDKLQGNITILPSEVTGANYLFYGCGLSKNVIFPLRYINNVNTATRNSLVTAATGGYAVGTAVGNLVNNTTQNAVFYAYDPIAWEGYSSWSGNGTHWTLSKWAGIGKAAGTTDVVVPQEITSYDTFPTAMNYPCFAGNTVINSIRVTEDIPWAGNVSGAWKNSKSFTGAFAKCANLKRVDCWFNDNVTSHIAIMRNSFNVQYVNIKFSNNATDLHQAFAFLGNCISFNTGSNFKPHVADIDISDIVTAVDAMYAGCTQISDFYINGTGVTTMVETFYQCNARPYNIYIKSPNVATVTNIFYGAVATYKKTLYIPYMNSDGTYTKTHNSFNAATYTNNATGNYYRYDISPYNSIADYWVTVTSPNLYLNTYRGQSATPTTVATSPFAGNTVYLLPSTYTANATLTYVDCNNVPFAGTTVLGAFKSCYTLQGVDNINVPSGVTTAQNMFYDCRELRSAHVNLPASCTTATTMFINCKNCTDIVLDAPGLTTMTNCFDACNSQPLNITLTSPNISTITNMFRRAVTTQRKNIYIYYKYSNGAFTTTYTKMNIAQYAGTSGLSNSASPKYNSTGNYYVYNLTAKYQDTNVANILAGFTYAQSGSTYNLTKYIGGAYAKVPKKEQVKLYPDSTSTTTYGVDTVIYNNCFNNTASLVSVDLRDVPFVSNSMYDAFYNCRNLISVYNINPNVTNMRSTFYSCFNLNQNIQIPSSVTNMSSTFESCHNFNQNIQIPNSVTNMYWAFSYCLNFSKNVTILSNQITSADNLFYGTTKAKNVYIPFKYSNGVKSATFNSFVTAGYLTAAGASTGQNGVTMHDLNA